MGAYLRHLQLETIRTQVIGTLFKTHSFYTRREDALDELKKRIIEIKGERGPPFSLTPGLQSHLPPISYEGKSPVIKQDMILVETQTKHADKVLENIFTAMLTRDMEKWPITGRLQFIPIRPFGKIDKNIIGMHAMKQNRYVSRLESYTLRGFKNLDVPLQTLEGDTVTLQKLLLFSKDAAGKYLFEMVERANLDRVFLIYDKKKTIMKQEVQLGNLPPILRRRYALFSPRTA